MAGVTGEQIERAKEWDLLSYLQAFEPQELRRAGKEYYTASHDSLKISNGKWHWHSRGIGGKSALDYLLKVRGMDFIPAVEMLCGGRMAAAPEKKTEAPPPAQEGTKKFYLPEGDRIGAAAVAYLQMRGIDADIISRCLGLDILYESRSHHNCVFVGYDPKGQVRYAALRGTRGNFKMEIEGSDKRYGFYLPARKEDSASAAVAESPIDALSLASLLKLQGEDWTKNHYLSLGGTSPQALLQFLHDHPAVTDVSLCMDNDRAGLAGMAKIREAVRADPELSGRIRVIADNPPPVFMGKDYNEVLQKKAGAMRKEKEQAKGIFPGR